MKSAGRGDRSSLQKIEVTCRTCGVTESFYSDLSVRNFKEMHAGHDVVGGVRNPTEKPAEVRPTPKPAPVEPVMKVEPPTEKDWGTKLSRVVVDVVVFPALRDSVFRVRGFKDDVEEAFVATSRFENGEMVKRMLESGEYVDYQSTGTRYVWDPSAIEYEGDAREVLGIPKEPGQESAEPEAPKEPAPAPELESVDDTTVARTNEALFGEMRSEPAAAKVDAVFPAPPEPMTKPETIKPAEPDAASIAFEEALRETQGGMAEPEPMPEPEPEPKEVVPPAPPAPPAPPMQPVPAAPAAERVIEPEPKAVQRVEPKQPEPEPVKIPPPPSEEEYLLVSKTWYIQGGEKNKKEAARVSQVLKDFRWRVEPLYTIGVILDDILSIETSKTQISRGLIRRVEETGYKLTAVTVEQGKPVAWFKRTEQKTRSPADLPPREQASLDDADAESEPDIAN